jgi:hypothetical protein
LRRNKTAAKVEKIKQFVLPICVKSGD